MKKLLIIGIDGMDREYVGSNLDVLPNFKNIIENTPQIKSSSVFPPDSDTAWASIYTGRNPANHGVIDFVDPLERNKINVKESEYILNYDVKGNTFWDYASTLDKKCCLLFPHIIYPLYDIKGGFMINPHPETGVLEIKPNRFLNSDELQRVKVIKRIPRNRFELSKYVENKKEVVKSEFTFLEKMLKKDNWDVTLFYSSVVDSIMHIFWNYCDLEDPTYPGRNKFEKVIIDFHIIYDKLVGEIINKYESEYNIIIMSDHGHFRRPTNLFNINEFLKQSGYLVAKEKNNLRTIKSKLKRLAVDIAQKSGMRPLAQTVLRIFPKIKNTYTKPDLINFDKTMAHCTDLSGLKAYTYGGIIVREENLPQDKPKFEIIDEIIKALEKVTLPDSDTKIFEWIKRREELYKGEYINRYPDIVFNLIDNYGAGWDVNIPLFTRSLAHKFYPGSHRGRTPVFYLVGNGFEVGKKDIGLMDVAPTILDLMGIDYNQYNFDGESIIKK